MRKKESKQLLKFLWIDDTKDRKDFVDIIEKKRCFPDISAKVNFLLVCDKDISDIVDQVVNSKTPDLIILDHFLDKVEKGFVGGRTTGTTVALMLKEKWPKCPIIGITAAKKIKYISVEQQKIYLEMFDWGDFIKHISRLLVMANDFKQYNRKRNWNKEVIVSFLKAPKEVDKQLLKVLPEEFVKQDDSILIRLYTWIRFTLLETPGFLYDELWTATFLGLSVDGFQKVKEMFDDACYDGIFSDNKTLVRWWPVKVKEILENEVNESGLSWDLGQKLKKFRSKDYSTCYVCKKRKPEIVGFTDDTLKKDVPMHLKCSQVIDAHRQQLYYEQIRKMKDDN